MRQHITYPEKTMFQLVEDMSVKFPNEPAYEFFDRKTSYKKFIGEIEECARAFKAMGIQKGEAVTICMPNVPHALIAFYAVNRIGAVANMVHPLSAEDEISFYLNFAESKVILTMDLFYEKVDRALAKVDHPVTILTGRMQDKLDVIKGTAFKLTTGRKVLKYPKDDHGMLWSRFLKLGKGIQLPEPDFDPKRTAVILYSGGTSGTPKGICLSDANVNATALQATEAIESSLTAGDRMLSCMPLFHGFGLGINIHTVLINGALCILMPTFNASSYADMLNKKHPNYIAGVPTIFEALLHIDKLNGKDMSYLKGMFCGGDSLSVELKRKVDTFLKEHNASIQIREGYGLTECVTASCLTPKDTYRENSIGLPFPDTTYCIVKPGTDEEVARGDEGEIILTGPSLMLGYLKNPEETAKTLRDIHGTTWLYTGDLGYMDNDGYVYYKQRIKRMIITNGYNVYPGQIENVIDGCPEVAYSCVIGVKDPRRVQRVRAYIVLKEGVPENDATKESIMNVLKQKVAAYALPKEIEFRDSLPKTLVGKIHYRTLEEQANKEEEEKNAEKTA